MKVDADLDGGSIVIVDAARAEEIALALRSDSANDRFRQWFHFRVRSTPGDPLRLRIVNIDEATYPDAFDGYRACASYDGVRWFRVPTELEDGSLVVRHVPEKPTTYFAYFAPYSVDRREKLARRSKRGARVDVLGKSVEERPIQRITFGDEDEGKLRIWITARQHPGETMAEWFAEGVILRLLDRRDEITKRILARAVVHVVPCVNPDGGVHGNLRTNAAGADLNRSWLDPSPAHSPEVLAVREAMRETGVDLFLDVHGDERNPYIFAAGCEGNPSYDDRIDELEDLFMESLVALDGDFQREYGYDRDAPGEGDLSCASNWVGEAFGCLSLTLEMPFKDNANHPDPARGWSPERAMHFGRSVLESVVICLDRLR